MYKEKYLTTASTPTTGTSPVAGQANVGLSLRPRPDMMRLHNAKLLDTVSVTVNWDATAH